MTVSFEGRIRDLLPEFLADALVLFRPFQTAGTVSAGPFQTFFDHLYHLIIFVQPNSHVLTSLPKQYTSNDAQSPAASNNSKR